jgi:protein O-mannosyl-transferase
VVPVLVGLALYVPALRNGFIWDDALVLQQLRAIHSIRDLLIPPAIIPHFYFRPVIFLSYLIDRALGGEAPFWFHASVLVGHALNTALVFRLARRLLPADWTVAGGAALLFAVFPTHVESVAWMAGRSDVIVCTFVLLTVLLSFGAEQARRWWLAGSTCLLAALSKEMGLACVLLVPLLDVLSTGRLRWARYAPLVVAAAIYFVLRQRALGVVVGGMDTGLTPAALAIQLVRAIGFYAAHAMLPIRLCAYMPAVPEGWPYLLLGFAVPFAGFGALALAWRRGHWAVAFLIAWFFVTLAPSLLVILRRSASALVADRYLYVPSVASCILLAWLCMEARRRWRMPSYAAAIGAAALLFAIQTVRYMPVWADDLAFWSDVAAKEPGEALPRRELATALQARGRLQEAENELHAAVAAPADLQSRVMIYNNLGNLYRRMARYDEALQAFETGIAIQPQPTLYHGIGMTLMAKIEEEQDHGDRAGVLRDIGKAREAFEQALQLGRGAGATQAFLEWDAAKTHALLGQVLFSLGDRAAARTHLETALQLEPTGAVADITRQYMQRLQQ